MFSVLQPGIYVTRAKLYLPLEEEKKSTPRPGVSGIGKHTICTCNDQEISAPLFVRSHQGWRLEIVDTPCRNTAHRYRLSLSQLPI